jgi:MFS family permease
MSERWRALWVLSAARVAMGFQFQAIGATAPLLREQWGLGLADIGWLVGLFLLPGALLALPSGLLSARFGDRRIAISGTALMVAGAALCAFAPDVATLQAGRLLGGTGGVLFNVTASKMVADWFAGREIELAMAVFVSTWPVGIGIGLLVLGPVAVAGSPAAAFAMTGALALVSLALVLRLYRPAPGAAATGSLRPSALARGDGLRLVLAASAWTTYNVAFALMVAFLPALFALRGLPVSQAGAITATLTATMIVSIPASGWLIGRFGRPMTIAVVGLLGWAVCLAAVRLGAPPLPWLTAAGLLSGTAAGVLVAAPARFLSPPARAIGLGLFYTMFYVGMGVLPRLVGSLADAFGSPEVVLLAAIGMVLATIGLMVALRWALPATARGA